MTEHESRRLPDNIIEYVNLTTDMRFYSEQRFKVITVYLLSCGLLLNVAKDHRSMILALLGVTFSYLCFSWEVGTALWWGTLVTRAQEIETLASDDGIVVETYRRYRKQISRTSINRFPTVRPSLATAGIYLLGSVGWLLFFVYSWRIWWS